MLPWFDIEYFDRAICTSHIHDIQCVVICPRIIGLHYDAYYMLPLHLYSYPVHMNTVT